METITSLTNERIKNICKLKNKKYRDETNLFMIEGDHLVKEAYLKNQLTEIFCLEEFNTENYDLKITYITKEVMKKISNLENPSQVVGICKKFNPLTYGKRLMILDNIQDPGNLGTIIRSASAFYIDTIILSNETVDLYNDKVIRSSEGMIFHTDVLRKEILPFLEELQKNNYIIYGTNVQNGQILNELDFEEKCAIIIGNEGKGMTKELENFVNKNIYIPMNKNTESLNAAVASSIIMYEMSKKYYE